jgi:hypothetical protein
MAIANVSYITKSVFSVITLHTREARNPNGALAFPPLEDLYWSVGKKREHFEVASYI